MVVLNEKDSSVVPPPPYFDQQPSTRAAATSTSAATASSSRTQRSSRSLAPTRVVAPVLPAHIQLLIVYATLPRAGELVNVLRDGARVKVRESAEATALRTTRTLYWIAFYLRCVNRGFYLASMHLLRSTFLGDYSSLVRPPYSSDPFPHTSLAASTRQPGPVVNTLIQSEAQVLDLYILHRLHEDVFAADSSLNIDRANLTTDLFAFMQPRSRLADLVRAFGAGAGLVDLGNGSGAGRNGTGNGSSSNVGGTSSDVGMLSSLVASQRARERELLRVRFRERAAAVNASRASSGGLNTTQTQTLPPQPQPQMQEILGQSLKSRSQISLPAYASRPASPSPSPSYPSYSAANNTDTNAIAGPSRSKASEAGYPEDDPHDNSYSAYEFNINDFSHDDTPQQVQRRVPHTSLRVTFSPRRIGLVYVPPIINSSSNTNTPSSSVLSLPLPLPLASPVPLPSPSSASSPQQHQSVADLPRTADEPLERAASRLVAALKTWLDTRSWSY